MDGAWVIGFPVTKAMCECGPTLEREIALPWLILGTKWNKCKRDSQRLRRSIYLRAKGHRQNQAKSPVWVTVVNGCGSLTRRGP